jgi:hypothetical protein
MRKLTGLVIVLLAMGLAPAAPAAGSWSTTGCVTTAAAAKKPQ